MTTHERKPCVPKVTDHVATPMRSRRNFVEKNALDAMISEPSNIEDPQFVDAPGGNKQSLQKSGMVPKHIEKKDFAKVPAYIKKIKKAKIEDQKRWEHEQSGSWHWERSQSGALFGSCIHTDDVESRFAQETASPSYVQPNPLMRR